MEAAFLVAAMKPLLPAAPPDASGPFALSSESTLRVFAVAGGLIPNYAIEVDTPWFYRDEATALRGFGSSGVAIRAIEYVGDNAFAAAIRAALAPFRQPDGSFRIGARARCIFATPSRKVTR